MNFGTVRTRINEALGLSGQNSTVHCPPVILNLPQNDRAQLKTLLLESIKELVLIGTEVTITV
jgi:hypothetical protein